jgi:IMP cyclohydrolase
MAADTEAGRKQHTQRETTMDFIREAQINFDSLKGNPYPGRGIVIGLSPDGKNIFQIYWIMGRSANSRNRVFVKEAGGHLKTRAFDESRMEDPSLIIYYPLRHSGRIHIVTNGDQTDTIYNFIREKRGFEEALNTRTYEPDAPNFTPRISGIVDLDSENTYSLSILKTMGNDERCVTRQFFSYSSEVPGIGHLITTYRGDGNPLPSFSGEPLPVPVHDSIETNLETYWSALNEDNRVSLLVKRISMETGDFDIHVRNRFS